MGAERATRDPNLIDVLDRILDKGIVIDPQVRISQVGIDLTTTPARVVITSDETYREEKISERTPATSGSGNTPR